MAIFAFGDSHTIVFCNVNTVHEHWLGFNTKLPLTMFRMGNEGLDITKAPQLLGNGHQKFVPVKGDTVLYSYGYNDVQKRILENKNTDLLKLVQNYLKQIKQNEVLYGTNSIVYGILPPPSKKAINGKGMSWIGTVQERIDLTKKLNNLLKQECKVCNLKFFNIHDLVTSSDGTIKNEFTKDGIHVEVTKQNCDFIENALNQIL
jgi:hypothetical protein